MAIFEPALRLVLIHEGVAWGPTGELISRGYCDHPSDPGGETIYGITKMTADAHGWTGPMSEMPLEFAESIYRREYWDAIFGDSISHQGIAEELFDTAVNCGIGTAGRFLQRALNVLNQRGTLWNDLEADGIIGGTTIATLEKACASRTYMGTNILRIINGLQIARYVELCERNENLEDFMPGWIRTRGGLVTDPSRDIRGHAARGILFTC